MPQITLKKLYKLKIFNSVKSLSLLKTIIVRFHNFNVTNLKLPLDLL